MIARTSVFALCLAFASNALAQNAQEPKKEDKTLETAGQIAEQPGKDVGIIKTKTPGLLAQAVKQPYALPASRTCRGYAAAIAELNAILGPDFGSNSEENENKFGQLATAGGEAIVGSLIPFRGLVREVSGAGPAERRLDAAVNAGLARRGFLRGTAQAKGCKLPAPPKVAGK